MGGSLVNDVLTQTMLIPLALGLILGEFTEVSPWLARRILRLAAGRLGNPEAAERYEAEWVALLEERPGKLLKLPFATWIALRATWELRAIHRPLASSPEASNPSATPPSEEDQSLQVDGPEPAAPRRQREAEAQRRGTYVRSHYRGRRYVRGYYRDEGGWMPRPRRRRTFGGVSPVVCLALLWVAMAMNETNGAVEFTAVGVAPALLALTVWFYSVATLKRVRSRLAASSLRRADWALSICKIPSEAAGPIRKTISDGGHVQITDPHRGGDHLLRVVDVALGRLAFVVRPRRHPKR